MTKGLLAFQIESFNCIKFQHLIGGEPESLSIGEDDSSNEVLGSEFINMFSPLNALKFNRGMSSPPPSVFGAISTSFLDQV